MRAKGLFLVLLGVAGCGSSHADSEDGGSDAGPRDAGLVDSAARVDGSAGGCREAADCAPDRYCAFEDGCGLDEAEGSCEPRPVDCPAISAPVCGCDLQTYGNDCVAAAAGVDVLRTGACEVACTADDPCTESLDACVGSSCSETWVCEQQRVCSGDFVPFCGCDGVTFMDSSTCPSRPYQARGECPEAVSCDPSPVACRRVMPTCPAGQVPSVEDACWGPCVAIGECACTNDDECPVGTCVAGWCG